MTNTDMCLNTCKTAKCGDGVVQMGVEQCDDGNMVDNDACSNTCKQGLMLRPDVRVCGTSSRPVSQFFPMGTNFNIILGNCTPTNTTQAMFVTRNAPALNAATIQTYLDQGGIILTEYTRSDEAYTAAFAAVAQVGTTGSCQDTAPTVNQFTPNDPIWQAIPFQMIQPNQTGCGAPVGGYPGVTPLAGWSANQVAIAYRDRALGRLWLTDFDWQDNEMVQPMAYTQQLMGYMMTHRK
jgi:cysteine-rich repeat protein